MTSHQDPMTHSEASRTLKGLVIVALVVAGLMLACAGCRTNGPQEDIYPTGYEQLCIEAKAQAVDWFVKKHNRQPIIPPCHVYIVEEQPKEHTLGLINNSGKGYWIVAWKHSPNLRGR